MNSGIDIPLPSSTEFVNSDGLMFGTCSATVPSTPWLEGRPPQWSENPGNLSSFAFLKAYDKKEPQFLSVLWANALAPHCRQVYLETLQGILKSLMFTSRTSARFDRYAMMVCFHLQTIVASLDLRSSYFQ